MKGQSYLVTDRLQRPSDYNLYRQYVYDFSHVADSVSHRSTILSISNQ